MKKLSKKLALRKEVVRSLTGLNLDRVVGGMINQTRSVCAGECPRTSDCGTGGPATGANFCLNTELTCFAC
jgi:hypothetical protein